MTACSCTALDGRTAKTATDPFLEAESAPVVQTRPSEPPGVARLTSQDQPEIIQTAAAEPAAGADVQNATTVVETNTAGSRVTDAAYTVPANRAAESVQQAAAQRASTLSEPQTMPSVPAKSVIQWTAAEERVPVTPVDCSAAVSQAELAQLYPDEYLFDGGDRGLPVHFNAFGMRGLETEDALVQYNDDEGRRHVKPTNRVAIYAPRFSAVASVSAPMEGVTVGRLAGTNVTTRGNDLRSRQGTTYHEQRVGTDRLVSRSRLSGLESGAGQHLMVSPLIPAMNEQAQRVSGFEMFLRTGQISQTDEAQLALGIQSAINWTRNQNPVIAAKLESASEVVTKANASEFVGLELERRKIGNLRIVKLADKKTAAPGDIVTFTIRYDNLGGREVRDVTIVDNLTPRLEYVDDSATSDRDGRLDTSDNAEGSLILRWTIDQPLPGQTGGVVTFKARVK